MKIESVVAPVYGGPQVLTLIERDLPDPADGQVLVEVRAAGTNPIDFKLFSGTYGDDPSRLPISPGFEVSGVVRKLGGDVMGPSGPIGVDDNVIVFRADGGYASHVIASADTVLSKPDAMTFEEASGLMLTGTTAVHALTVTRVSAGDTILIHGAAGGVGLMAVQLAVGDGATVIGTAGEAQHDLLRALGALPVTYGAGLLERVRALAPHGVDVAIDLIGSTEAGDVSFALADNSRIVTIVASGHAKALGAIVIGGGGDPGTAIRDAARLELLRRVEAGTLKVVVESAYPLADASSALEELASGHAHGKIVLTP
jgi:NADPH2:quinone reductase